MISAMTGHFFLLCLYSKCLRHYQYEWFFFLISAKLSTNQNFKIIRQTFIFSEYIYIEQLANEL